ncbi:ankyrin repeat domain-containing protein [bacterium]|nr:ankyrin repeat domain-containing protein [bacterium]MDC0319254.1 ankyrin repeat domain-containing protein [Verrucomicrobiota bacterium]
MKHLLLTTIAAVVLVGTVFADPIHDAARNGDLAGVQAELDKGVDVNAKREGGSTPLHGAAEGGHEEIVKLLIVAGADLHARTVPMLGGGGWTPLHSAARQGHKEIVELLIANGTDVNSRDSTSKSSLHDAALEGHKEIVELLIIKGADLNADSGYYGTPLHVAAGIGHKEIVELLIINGADVNVKDGFGRTPLDTAELVYEWDSPEAKAAKKNIADVIRKHQLILRLTYSRELSSFSFTGKDAKTYVVEVTQDFKQWGELETIEGTGKQVKFIDPRQPLVQFKRNFYRVKVVE